MTKIGIIGGSGLYNVKELEEAGDVDVHTPYGETSSPLRIEIIRERFDECLRNISMSRITVLKEDETKSVLTFRVFVLFFEVKLSTEF